MNDLIITVDYRENASRLTDLLKNSGALIEIKKLTYGDYIINGRITVERKTAKDFLISIIDGRLFNQLSSLKKFCSHLSFNSGLSAFYKIAKRFYFLT